MSSSTKTEKNDHQNGDIPKKRKAPNDVDVDMIKSNGDVGSTSVQVANVAANAKDETLSLTTVPSSTSSSKRVTKKQKNGTTTNTTTNDDNNNQKKKSTSALTFALESSSASPFKPFDLNQIKISIENLSSRVPTIPSNGLDPNNQDQVRQWALSMQAIIEEFNLLLTCVSTATYKWGTDRTGAADQNLSLLSNELCNSQEQISASVTQRISNVLAPVVELVTKETIIKKVTDEKTGEVYERRIHEFTREDNDPNFIQLCNLILCRNAVMLRHVVLTNFSKAVQCIQDYLNATKKDGNHGRSAFY